MNYLMIVSAVFLLAACGNSEEETKTKTEEAPEVESSEQNNKPQILSLTLVEKEVDELSVETKAQGQDIEYAYYVMTEEDEIVEKFMYDEGPTFTYKVTQPGRYKVRLFVRDQDGNKDRKDTEVVEFPY